jgi:murein DD-endopeptidase MepM/ murein hydrolase activator NlpD
MYALRLFFFLGAGLYMIHPLEAQEWKTVNTLTRGMMIVTIKESPNQTTYDFYAKNNDRQVLELRMDIKLTNMKRDLSTLPVSKFIPGGTEVKFLSLSRFAKGKPFSYKIVSWDVISGIAQAQHTGEYQAPFSWGRVFRVDNAFSGYGAHSQPPNQYAVDFKMPIGTAVHCARAGVVTEVRSDSNSGGADQSFTQSANYLTILHPDGTSGRYLHFMYNGVIIKKGQQVETGQLVGYSGNTGWSTDPHLHFDVVMSDGNRGLKTIPFQFQTKEGLQTPILGMMLSRSFLSNTENVYEVKVKTKDKWLAGTDAHVFVTLNGSSGSSGETELIAYDRNPFERNQTDVFLLDLPNDLGNIASLRIRHDNSGAGSGWYLDWIEVKQLKTGNVLRFPCDKWLATDEGDKKIDRTLNPNLMK